MASAIVATTWTRCTSMGIATLVLRCVGRTDGRLPNFLPARITFAFRGAVRARVLSLVRRERTVQPWPGT